MVFGFDATFLIAPARHLLPLLLLPTAQNNDRRRRACRPRSSFATASVALDFAQSRFSYHPRGHPRKRPGRTRCPSFFTLYVHISIQLTHQLIYIISYCIDPIAQLIQKRLV